MNNRLLFLTVLLLCSFPLAGCKTKTTLPLIDTGNVAPGSTITRKGEPLSLTGTPIEVGQRLPATELVNAFTMDSVNLRDSTGDVLFLSIVPSLDTRVCEAQTHYLGEQGDKLPASVKRITISRDTPFAQKRFAEGAELTDILFLSDYKEGAFGRSMGLLIEGPMLLARSVILVDRKGFVRYIQVVPEITNLPDMEKAFTRATELAGQP